MEYVGICSGKNTQTLKDYITVRALLPWDQFARFLQSIDNAPTEDSDSSACCSYTRGGERPFANTCSAEKNLSIVVLVWVLLDFSFHASLTALFVTLLNACLG